MNRLRPEPFTYHPPNPPNGGVSPHLAPRTLHLPPAIALATAGHTSHPSPLTNKSYSHRIAFTGLIRVITKDGTIRNSTQTTMVPALSATKASQSRVTGTKGT